MEDDMSYERIKKLFESWDRQNKTRPYSDYDVWNSKTYLDEYTDYQKIDIKYDILDELRKTQEKAELKKKRLAACPHYIQTYGEDQPDGSVTTKWTRYEGIPNDFSLQSREARSIVYQDGEDFLYYHRWKGEYVGAKSYKMTEEQKKEFLLNVLRADNG